MNVENMYDAWDNGDRHEIRQMLAQKNKKPVTSDDDDTQVYRSELESAVKAAVEAERAACAKAVEEEIKRVKPIYSVTAEAALKAILARGASK